MRVATLAAAAASTLLVSALLSALPASAGATCTPGLDTNMDTSQGSIDCPGKGGGQEGGGGDQTSTGGKKGSGAKPVCVWVPKPDYQSGVGEPIEGQGGHYYQRFCAFGEYKTLADFQRALDGFDAWTLQQANMVERAGLEVQFFTTPPPAPRPTPEQVMQSIVDNLPFPDTYIAVNPAADKLVVDLPTWVWLTDASGKYVPDRYTPKAKSIELEGYQLRWQIVPQVTLTPGDTGPDQTCTNAGVPWSAAADGNPKACTITYTDSGQYTLSATVGWTVQWWLGNDPQDDIPGPTNTATQPVTVLEIQTINR